MEAPCDPEEVRAAATTVTARGVREQRSQQQERLQGGIQLHKLRIVRRSGARGES